MLLGVGLIQAHVEEETTAEVGIRRLDEVLEDARLAEAALIERGSRKNLEVIDAPAAAAVLDSLTFDENEELAVPVTADVEDKWAY